MAAPLILRAIPKSADCPNNHTLTPRRVELHVCSLSANLNREKFESLRQRGLVC